METAINKLQEDLTSQKIITETVTKENLELKVELEELKKSQSGLEEKIDEMTNLFRTTFRDLTKTTAETIVARARVGEDHILSSSGSQQHRDETDHLCNN